MNVHRRLLLFLFFSPIYLFPILIYLQIIISGSFPFWYDPSRDLILAQQNLHKPTLIGPPSGIPGIFYGPYWIWALSISSLVSLDPRVINFLVACLPYILLFPITLWLYTRRFHFNQIVSICLWLLSMLAFTNYATQLWNPNAAPVLFFFLTYLFLTSLLDNKNRRLKMLISGLLAGVVMNIHISFGLCIIVSCYVLLIGILTVSPRLKHTFLSHKQPLQLLVFFSLGIMLAYLPFFAFELKHSFLQTTSLMHALSQEIFHQQSVVVEKGLSQQQIITNFFAKLGNILDISQNAIIVVYLVAIAVVTYFMRHRKKLFSVETKLLSSYVGIVTFVLFVVYLSAKNPVWDYHFIGTEILFIFILLVLCSYISLLRYLLIVWTCIVIIIRIIGFSQAITHPPLDFSSLQYKDQIVTTIYRDGKDNSLAIHVYSPFLIPYDYNYIILWQGQVYHHASDANDPLSDQYLLIPWTLPKTREQYIETQTPSSMMYTTTRVWTFADGTKVVKRQRK